MIQSVIFDIQQKLNNKEITCLELVQDKINALKQANDNATNLILEQEALIHKLSNNVTNITEIRKWHILNEDIRQLAEIRDVHMILLLQKQSL